MNELRTLGTICTGIGGWDIGFEQAGWTTSWQIELDDVNRHCLADRFPRARQFKNVRDWRSHRLSPVRCIAFSSPCQNLSIMANFVKDQSQRGLGGGKSCIFFDCMEVVAALGPELVVFENAAGNKRMSTALDILRALMARVRRELFAGRPDKAWFSQQQMVKKALTYPAHWLHERHIPFTADRYQRILDDILTGIARKGNLAQVGFPGRYLLHCVQEHMRHHDDTYYNEGKNLALDVALRRLERAPRPADPVITALAQTHALITLGKRQKKAPALTLQPDLFGAAKTRARVAKLAEKQPLPTPDC